MPRTLRSLKASVSLWLDSVPAYPSISTLPKKRLHSTDMDSTHPFIDNAEADDNDDDEDFPPAKRARNIFDDSPMLSPAEPSTGDDSFPTVQTHNTGRLSPVKQIQTLEDSDWPVVFCNFFDLEIGGQVPESVTQMHTAIQTLADGIGILDYDSADAFKASIAKLPKLDQSRLQYATAKDATRTEYGVTPSIYNINAIVCEARTLNHGTGGAETPWNEGVHRPLLLLALRTSRFSETLSFITVKTARVDPPTLVHDAKLPGRIIDYVFCLQPDKMMKKAYGSLQRLNEKTVKSWNHITAGARDMPIAINIETKSPMKSWTDGKPQIGIWTNAWLHRCELLCKKDLNESKAADREWPAVPVVISQGHEWHLLIANKTKEGLVFREMITIGSTRNCFDALKIVAVLHWLMDWAETVWRPWFLSLIAQDDE